MTKREQSWIIVIWHMRRLLIRLPAVVLPSWCHLKHHDLICRSCSFLFLFVLPLHDKFNRGTESLNLRFTELLVRIIVNTHGSLIAVERSRC
jgi:hypothetical protein